MRRLMLLAAVGGAIGCGTEAPAGGVSLVLDIPNGALDPAGFTTVEVTFHEPNGDVVRSAAISAERTFDLGDLAPSGELWVEATLRNDAGTALGYGRTATTVALEAGAQIVVPVRRPIVYFAGLVSDVNIQTSEVTWSNAPATVSDLSLGGNLDGRSRIGTRAVLMIAAGPELYMVEQSTSNPRGDLVGPAMVRPVAASDHAIAAPLPGTASGGVLDGAGSDDGKTLVIGTTTKLFVVDTTSGAVREVASGAFSRVAMIAGPDGATGAIAVKNRPVTTGGSCAETAELVWVELGTEIDDVRTIATGSFTDVASDRGKAYFVDCNGQLGEASASGTTMIRSQLGRATALAVSSNQAYIGIERPAAGGVAAALSLLVAPLADASPPRVLWSEASRQVLDAPDYPGVQRLMSADRAAFGQLEVGAGGDYVAATMSSHFFGPRVAAANFPE
ncbi:MAG: hypothetical protein ACTHU0_26945, partial [Kofleriaceae bacterium]